MKMKQEKRLTSTSHSVVTAKRLYHQKYRKEWEKNPRFKPWLKSSYDGYTAHCQACDVDILARLASIKQHENTIKHQNGMKCNQVLLNMVSIVKEEDGQLLPDLDERPASPSTMSENEEFIPMQHKLKLEQPETIPPYRYRKEWEDIPTFSSWLQPTNIPYMAHCKLCSGNMLARIASIKQHESSAKHQNALKYNKIFINCLNVNEKADSPTEDIEERKPKIKSKPKAQSIPKQEQVEVEHIEYLEENENGSNSDSILDTLLDIDDVATYSNDEDLAETEEQHEDQDMDQQEIFYTQDVKMDSDELNEDAISNEEQEESIQVINEFDLFGKSVALQLNQMDLEDALLCQDRLQTVITNFRLMVLKRQRHIKSPAVRK